MILLVTRESLGGKGITGPIPPSFCLNPFPPRLATLLILFCLTPGKFTYQGRAFGWESVEGYRGIELSASVLQIFVCL